MMKELMELKELFDTNKSGDTHCFSLVCWTDGLWSVNVTDSWRNWLDYDVPALDYKYDTPNVAIREFLRHLKEHSIVPSELQEKEFRS